MVYFRKYYENRRARDLVVENPRSMLTSGKYTEQMLADLILNNPFKRFAIRGIMRFDQDDRVVQIDEEIWANLTEEDETEIERICDEKLQEFYATRF